MGYLAVLALASSGNRGLSLIIPAYYSFVPYYSFDEMQGYLFSRPLPAADMEAMLRREK